MLGRCLAPVSDDDMRSAAKGTRGWSLKSQAVAKRHAAASVEPTSEIDQDCSPRIRRGRDEVPFEGRGATTAEQYWGGEAK